MSPRTQLIGIIAIVLALVLIVELVRRRRLRTGYSLLWLFVGLLVLILAVWKDLVAGLAQFLGVQSPGSMLFAAGILFALLILLEHSLALSTLWYDNKSLTQEIALLEWRISQLEATLERTHAMPGANVPPLGQPEGSVASASKEEILASAT
jgi:hypothetical protein